MIEAQSGELISNYHSEPSINGQLSVGPGGVGGGEWRSAVAEVGPGTGEAVHGDTGRPQAITVGVVGVEKSGQLREPRVVSNEEHGSGVWGGRADRPEQAAYRGRVDRLLVADLRRRRQCERDAVPGLAGPPGRRAEHQVRDESTVEQPGPG